MFALALANTPFLFAYGDDAGDDAGVTPPAEDDADDLDGDDDELEELEDAEEEEEEEEELLEE